MHMFRVQKFLIGAILFLAQPAVAQSKTAWIGEHLQGLRDPTDAAEYVRDMIELRLSDIRTSALGDPGVSAFVAQMDVRTNSNIDTSADGRKMHYDADPNGTLLVASGRGIGTADDFEAGVYLGPRRQGFEVETARARLLAVASHDVAEMYLRLLLHYALIKEAKESDMDFRTVISPLRSAALDLSHQAQAADPVIVDLIREELVQLREISP